LARVPLDRLEPRHHLRPLLPLGRRDAVRPRPAGPRGEAGEEAPLALPPVRDALAAPCPGGQSALDGALRPMTPPTFLGHPQKPRWHRGQRAIRLPPLPPARRGTLGRPLRPTRDSTPAPAGQHNVEQGMHELAARDLGHPPATLRRCRRKDVLAQAPLSITDACKASCHTAHLALERTVERKFTISGIDSCKNSVWLKIQVVSHATVSHAFYRIGSP
jgi:hypothetical protein